MNSSDPSILLSIIICTHKRPKLLARTLQSVSLQMRDRIELIVIDNDSRDKTEIVALDCPHARYVMEPRRGLSHARNRGADEARGEYLLYVDDDIRLCPNYVAATLAMLETSAPDIWGGPVVAEYERKPAWFPDKLETKIKTSASGFSTTVSPTGANFGIRRDVLERLGGFDPHYGMNGRHLGLLEEADLVLRYRRSTPAQEHRVYYDLDCTIEHFIPTWKTRFMYQARRAYHGGHAKAHMLSASNQQLMPIKGVVKNMIDHAKKLPSDPVLEALVLCRQVGQIVATWQIQRSSSDKITPASSAAEPPIP